MKNQMSVTPWQNNNSRSTTHKHWYVKPVYEQTFTTDELAEHIALDSGLERTTVNTIVAAVTKQIRELLCNGHPIRIPHLGLLKLGATSTGAATLEQFNANRNIKGLHIVLTPDKEIKQAISEMTFKKYVPVKKVSI